MLLAKGLLCPAQPLTLISRRQLTHFTSLFHTMPRKRASAAPRDDRPTMEPLVPPPLSSPQRATTPTGPRSKFPNSRLLRSSARLMASASASSSASVQSSPPVAPVPRTAHSTPPAASDAPTSSPPSSRRTRPFTRGQPTAEYMRLSSSPSVPSPTGQPYSNPNLLLILDMNGTLVYRAPKRSHRSTADRAMYLRPYVRQFMDWMFHRETPVDSMVWSSAKPVNVVRMAREAFGPYYEADANGGKLRRVWGRDTLGLSQADYNNKVQTVKNLDRVWASLPDYDLRNTILLDDSPLKAHMQPYNHIVLREYDGTLHDTRRHNGPEADTTLLAVIGILSRAIYQSNVAQWVKSGALWGETGKRMTTPGNGEDMEGGGQVFWYDEPSALDGWVERGKAELVRLRIPLVYEDEDELAFDDSLVASYSSPPPPERLPTPTSSP